MTLGNLIATGAAVLALGGVTALAAVNLTSAPIGGGGAGVVASPTAYVCSAGETGGHPGCGPPGTLVSATGTSSPYPTAHQGDTVSESADASASPSPNHGQAVSNAAHTCPKGAGGVHGSCVSAVAHGSPSRQWPPRRARVRGTAITEPTTGGGGRWAHPRRHRQERGVSMVEFALAAPLAFLLLLGLVVVGITVTHQIQLNQAVKNSARAVAICGVAAEQNPYNSPAGTLPNGRSCTPGTNGNVQAYINGQLDGVASGLGGQDTVTVYDTSGSATVWTSTELADACSPGEIIQVSISYQQPLYLPLVGYALGNGPTDTRQLSADGEATC